MTRGFSLRRPGGRPLFLILTVFSLLLTLGAAQPGRAASFVTFASTRTFSFCNVNATSGGTFDGTDLASAVAPTATTLGTCNLLNVDAIGNASALLATGQLHIFASATGPADSFVAASMADSLTLIPPGGFANPTFPVTFTMTLSGTLSGNAEIGAQLSATSAIDSQKSQLALCSGRFGSGCGSSNILSVTVNVLTSAPIVGFSELLNGEAGNCISSFLDCYPPLSGVADYAHTAQLSIQLPPGFSFTSSSAVLLTQVPEPSEEPLLAMAFGLFGLARAGRRRDRKRRHPSERGVRTVQLTGASGE